MADVYYRDRNKGKVDKEGKKLSPNWQYRFVCGEINGVRKEVQKGGFATKRDAVIAGTKAYSEYKECGKVFIPSEMLYEQCLDEWMNEYVRVECNKVTCENYEKQIRLHIKPNLGKYVVSALDPDTIQKFINRLYKDGYARNRLSVFLGIISGSLKYAKKMKWVKYNEAVDVSIPSVRACKDSRKKVRVPVPTEIIKQIFDRFPEGHTCHIPLVLGYRGGLRIGEAFALTWQDVDFESSSISVNQQVQWDKDKQAWNLMNPKYDSKRNIPMDKDTMDLLKREHERQLKGKEAYGHLFHQLYRDSGNYIVNSDDGDVIIDFVSVRIDGTYIQPRVMQHCSSVIHHQIGYKEFDFHSLRHTHATMLAESGVNPKEIQRRLGHKTLDVTMNDYTHPSQKMLDDSRKMLDLIYGQEES